MFVLTRALDARVPGRSIVDVAVSVGEDNVAVLTSAGGWLVRSEGLSRWSRSGCA